MELFFTDHKLRLIASEICLALQGRIQYAPTFGMAIIAENDLNYFDLVGKNHLPDSYRSEQTVLLLVRTSLLSFSSKK
jgi:hypothetical protein